MVAILKVTYDFLLVFNDYLRSNSIKYWDIGSWTIREIEFDLLRSCKVKLKVAILKLIYDFLSVFNSNLRPIYDFLLVFNGNLRPNSTQLSVIARDTDYYITIFSGYSNFNKKKIHRKKARKNSAFKFTGLVDNIMLFHFKPKSQNSWSGFQHMAIQSPKLVKKR